MQVLSESASTLSPEHRGDRYRALEEARLPGFRSVLAIARWNLRLLVRQRLFWLLFGLGMLHFLMHFALIYVKANLEVRQPALQRFLEQYLVTGDRTAYREFLRLQALAVMMMLAYTGIHLVTNDFRTGGLVYYFAKPMGKWEWILGKLVACGCVVFLMTLLPASILFVEYGLYSTDPSYLWTNPTIIRGILGYSLLLMLVPSALMLGLGVVGRKPAPFLMSWCGVFIALPVMAELLKQLFNDRRVRLLDLWKNLRILGDLCFGGLPIKAEEAYANEAIVVVMGVMLLSIVGVYRRLRAIDVVT